MFLHFSSPLNNYFEVAPDGSVRTRTEEHTDELDNNFGGGFMEFRSNFGGK